MLIRFSLSNYRSFGEQKEFNMLSRPRYSRLSDHKYKVLGLEILKMTAIYGANASGKSNLIKAIRFVKSLIIKPETSFPNKRNQFKFLDEHTPQVFNIEFIQNGKAFYYGLEITSGIVTTEELYLSGLGKKDDVLLFERKTNFKGDTSLRFMEDFEKKSESAMLKSLLVEEFIKNNQSVFRLLSKRKYTFFLQIKEAYSWFSESLQIIDPATKPIGLALQLEERPAFRKFAVEMMQTFDVGINSICIEKQPLNEYCGTEKKEFFQKTVNRFKRQEGKGKKGKNNFALFEMNRNDRVIIKEDDKIFVKQIKFEHQGESEKKELFSFIEESDGTVRLLEFIPAFEEIVNKHRVYLIDEIERSLHPLIVKGLVEKFSKDKETKGQLIFTTHESNLLDQEILRQDEIWFTEKNLNGMTDLYSLSDFKEHNTVDIRKGYLTGRFGSIPFLANLKDLNWKTNVE